MRYICHKCGCEHGTDNMVAYCASCYADKGDKMSNSEKLLTPKKLEATRKIMLGFKNEWAAFVLELGTYGLEPSEIRRRLLSPYWNRKKKEVRNCLTQSNP